MPTHEESPAFVRDYGRLTDTQQDRFGVALGQFIADLRAIEAGERYWFRPVYESSRSVACEASTR